MKLITAIGVALAAGATAAYAQTHHYVVVRDGGGMEMNMDANHDGWLTRDEAAAAADRMFDRMDSNHDGRLTEADRPAHDDVRFRVRPDTPGHEADDPNCTTTRTSTGPNQNQVTVICNGDDDADANGHSERRVVITRSGDGGVHTAPQAGQHVERDVTIVTRGDDDAEVEGVPAPPAPPEAPEAPRPPHPPMFMMLLASSDEADTNHDGALSRDEFRAQQLRFFDASDVNGDHRIKFDPPPEPPLPPLPPQPPMPPMPPTPPAHH